jgi:hypothetical protein
MCIPRAWQPVQSIALVIGVPVNATFPEGFRRELYSDAPSHEVKDHRFPHTRLRNLDCVTGLRNTGSNRVLASCSGRRLEFLTPREV